MSKKFYQAVHQIITTGHWITDRISAELKVYDMTEPQFNVLRILRGAKGNPLTVQEILEQMVQRSSNITRIVDRLIGKGMVERKECATNRRKMDVSITEKGLTQLKKLDQKVAQFYAPMTENLNDAELESLVELIKKLQQR